MSVLNHYVQSGFKYMIDDLANCDVFTNRQAAVIEAAMKRAADLGEIDPSLAPRHVICFLMILNGALYLVRTNGLDKEVLASYSVVRQTVQGWRPPR